MARRHDYPHGTDHMHACAECHRLFYRCSQRDCTLVPDICRGCEMDRQDVYLTSLETITLTRTEKDLNHEKH